MSRIAKEPIIIPKDVETNLAGTTLTIKGAKGSISLDLNNEIELEEKEKCFYSASSIQI